MITGLITQGGLETVFRALKKAVIERAMSAEMNDHLDYRHEELKSLGQTNQRNATSGKTVLTDDGPVDIEVPRDREGNQGYLAEMYGTEVSPDFVSRVTDEVMAEVILAEPAARADG